MSAPLPPTAWTTGSTEVFKTGTWRIALPQYHARPSPCREACPVNGDIAQWIGHARAGDFRRAWDVLVANNPFPAIAGRVCHHPCESACNRAQFDEAVSVCALERAVGDTAIAQGWAFAAPVHEREGHIAVIGGGPSGLSAAYHLRLRGWRVSLYEARGELGGLMRHGIPPYRLAREVLDAEISRIVAMGVQVHTRWILHGDRALERLRATHDAVYVATGAARPRPLPQALPGASWWMQGSDYLARFNAGERPALGARVLVIGGGSAAMDVARSARRQGCAVAVLALEPRERMPAQRDELEEAVEEGVALHDGAMLRGVVKTENGLSIDCTRVRFEGGAPGETPRFTPLDDAFTVIADTVLVAIGQDTDTAAFPQLPISRGVFAVDAAQRSAHGKVWAGGDAASLARFVTEAVGMGKRAAIDIDRELRGLAREAAASAVAATGLDEIATWYHARMPRATRSRLASTQRVTVRAEVQLPLQPWQVAAEAARCFSCGTCTHCDNCFEHCPDMAVIRTADGYEVLADYCKGCGICVRECPTGSMLMHEESR